MTFSYHHHHSLLLLGAQLVLSGWVLAAPNNFFYHNYLKGNGSRESMIEKKRHILQVLGIRSIVHIWHSSFQWHEASRGLFCWVISGHIRRAQCNHTVQVLVRA